MKKIILPVLLLWSFVFYGQTTDPQIVKMELDSLFQLNNTLFYQGKVKDGMLLIEEALEKSKTTFGENSIEFAESVYYFGRNLSRLRDLKGAEEQLFKAKKIYETLGETDHITYAKLLNTIGFNYIFLGRFKEAEKFYLESDGLWRKMGLEEHIDYVENLMHLGYVNDIIGDLDKALEYNFKALAIKEKQVGVEHGEYARVLNNIGSVYAKSGKLERALETWLEALDIMEKNFGKESPDYAGRLNNVGIVYHNLGQYKKSEEASLTAKEIFAKTIGKENMDYAKTLNTLGILYKNMGQYDKAVGFYTEAKSIYPETTLEYAKANSNLAVVYSLMKDYEKAIGTLLETQKIYESIYENDHRNLINNLSNLGSFYRESGNLKEAEIVLLDVSSRAKNLLGENHTVYAECIGSLGLVNLDLGKYDEAEKLLLASKKIWKDNVGSLSLNYIKNLFSEAQLYQLKNEFGKTENVLSELFQLKKNQLISSTSFLSDGEKENLIRSEMDKYFHQIQSAADKIESSDFQNLQFDLALLTKGNRLQANRKTVEYVMQKQNPEAFETYSDLIGVRRQLSMHYQEPGTSPENIKMLEEKENELEKELARLSATFQKEQSASEITYKEVKSALQAQEAAIEFVHYNYKSPKPTDSIMYAAVVLLPNEEHAQFIPLFEEKELEQLLQNKQADKSDFYSEIYASRGISPKNKKKALSERVYNLVWKPLESKLANVETIYFSPTGLMHRMNLAALPLSEGKILGDKHQMVQLSSTREIALNEKSSEESIQQALVMGGINYDQAEVEEEEVVALVDTEASNLEDLLKRSGNASENWKYLPGTEKEVKEIQSIFEGIGTNSELYTSGKATEEIVKSIGVERDAPQVLHFATHGFFFPDQDEAATEDENAPVFKVSEHPMIRSGLVMAGGNHVWQGKEPIPDREDGILTAYEISQLNLTNTDLVVLSACETGLGDIKGSEGVFGLQRAFKIAGAKNLIMSLWQVPDEPTQDLITTFYTRWLVDKKDISEAFSSAQKEMKKKYKDPFFWAGFVLVR